MDPQGLQRLLKELDSTDDRIRMGALDALLEQSEGPVDWAYIAWDQLVSMLGHPNSFHRSIAIKLLCSLAKSDTEDRLGDLLPYLLEHTRDEKFITSRQTLQYIWKVALTNPLNRTRIVEHLVERYKGCVQEKHYNLLRRDIIQSLWMIHSHEPQAVSVELIQNLIGEDQEKKYRKSYQAVLKYP